MKKIILGLVLVTAGYAVNAQSFNIGMGGGIFSTWLINTNVSDQGDDLDFGVTFGGQIGLNMQYYFNQSMGLSMGVLYTGHNQKYTGSEIAGGSEVFSMEAKTKMRYLDIPFMLRVGGQEKGAYFEFGPQFGFLMSAKENATLTFTEPGVGTFIVDTSGVDAKYRMKSSNIALVLGFGVDIAAGENILITTGLRLGYGFNDVTKEYPTADALNDDPHILITSATYNAHWKQSDSGDIFKYTPTRRAFGGFFFSVMYKIPMGGSKGAPVPETK